MLRPSHESIAIAVSEESATGHARRLAVSMAEKLGFDETASGRLALVVTEAGTNLLRHGGGGEILLRPLMSGPAGVEVLALDQGPGMANVAQCLQDGYSTAGTSGAGLGSIMRLSDCFDIHSAPGSGTALLARVHARPITTTGTTTGTITGTITGTVTEPAASSMELGVVCVSQAGEEVCGDAWAVAEQPGRWVIGVLDGLGHGPLAAEASHAALVVFDEHADKTPRELLGAMHGALRSTRGAAVGMVAIDTDSRTLIFAGIGNISGTIIDDARGQSLPSHNGIVGQQVTRIQEFTYTWPRGALLVLHSDGLGTRWNLDDYPGLAMKAPSLIAGVLYRDFTRRRDDVTVLVARERVTDGAQQQARMS